MRGGDPGAGRGAARAGQAGWASRAASCGRTTQRSSWLGVRQPAAPPCRPWVGAGCAARGCIEGACCGDGAGRGSKPRGAAGCWGPGCRRSTAARCVCVCVCVQPRQYSSAWHQPVQLHQQGLRLVLEAAARGRSSARSAKEQHGQGRRRPASNPASQRQLQRCIAYQCSGLPGMQLALDTDLWAFSGAHTGWWELAGV